MQPPGGLLEMDSHGLGAPLQHHPMQEHLMVEMWRCLRQVSYVHPTTGQFFQVLSNAYATEDLILLGRARAEQDA